jgi:glycosyltransferase involved in cell wall biosynthesis
MNFDLTVITPVYNSVDFIERTIESVLSQLNVNVEYIIIDGGSSDGTVDIISRYNKQVNLFISEKDNGLYDAINKGIKYASSNRIVVLNSGDYYIDQLSLSKLVYTSIENADKCIVFGLMRVQDEDGSNPVIYGDISQGKFFFYRGCDVPHPTTLVPKKLYDLFGLYSLDYNIMSDYDLLLRMHMHNVNFINTNSLIIVFQRGGISSTFLKCLPESHRIRKQNKIPIILNYCFTFRSLLFYMIHQILLIFGISLFTMKKIKT